MKLRCKYKGEYFGIREGCNCLLLVGLTKSGCLRMRNGDIYFSAGIDAIFGLYPELVEKGKISDLRPWIKSFRNADKNGKARPDLSRAWWKKVLTHFQEGKNAENWLKNWDKLN